MVSMKFRKSLRPLGFLFSPAYGVIFCGDPRLGQRVEQSAFTDIGQTNDAAFQTHENFLKNQSPNCTIEPNVGIVEVPDAQLGAD
jgi:hypothetical protein